VGKALWRRAFDAVEGAVGPLVEQGVQASAFSTTVVLKQRTTSVVTALAERRTRQLWHLLNLPAGSDVRRLRRQLGDLDREVRLLRDLLQSPPPGKEGPRGRASGPASPR
jgi:hypothetical protein